MTSYKRGSCRVPLFELTARDERQRASCAEGAANSETTMTEQRKAVIKNADMSEDMQQEAVDCASQALSKYNIEKVSEREGQDTAETAACGNWLALEFRDNASVEYSPRRCLGGKWEW